MSKQIEESNAFEFFSRITKALNIVILSHTNPDGDAVGSSTALYRYFKHLGKNAIVILPDNYPSYLEFLDKEREIVIHSLERERAEALMGSADLIIGVDFNNLNRIGHLEQYFLKSSAIKILIDHHPQPDSAQFNLLFSKTELSSTCELIYWLMKESDKLGENGKIPLDVAESLYVGMMTDTNNFNNSVSSDTFSMASDLIAQGVDKESLQNLVFGAFTELRMRLMGFVLLKKMVLIKEYGAALITLSLKEQEQFNMDTGDTEGFVNLPLNIKGITISAFFVEKEDHIRVSLRSNNQFSVNMLSMLHFNGGGHQRAAGGKLYDTPFDELEEYLYNALKTSYDVCNGNED